MVSFYNTHSKTRVLSIPEMYANRVRRGYLSSGGRVGPNFSEEYILVVS